MVGWSGTLANQVSSLHLNKSALSLEISRMSLGIMLNSLHPLTFKDASLAFFTVVEDWFLSGLRCPKFLTSPKYILDNF